MKERTVERERPGGPLRTASPGKFPDRDKHMSHSMSLLVISYFDEDREPIKQQMHLFYEEEDARKYKARHQEWNDGCWYVTYEITEEILIHQGFRIL